MELTTYEKNNSFSMDMSYFEGMGFDNKIAMNKRFSIIFIEKGSGIIQIKDKKYSFISPAIFCINEQERVIIDNSIVVKVILFHPNIINCSLNFENIRNLPSGSSITIIQDAYLNKFFVERNKNYYGKVSIGPISFKRMDMLRDAFQRESTLQNRDNWPCRSRSFIMEILFVIDNIFNDGDINKAELISSDDEDIQRIILYLSQNYNRKITITELTKEFNINRTTLSEKFNDSVGESVITYLNKLRINMASIILRDTKLPVNEVMVRVGFSDTTHFLRTFKKYIGLSPREYRDKYCWM